MVKSQKRRTEIKMDEDIDLNEAYMYGGKMGGEYLKEIKLTDLAAMTPGQALTFCECVCKGYDFKMAELENKLNFC